MYLRNMKGNKIKISPLPSVFMLVLAVGIVFSVKI